MSRDTEMGWILAKLKRPEPAAFVLAGAPGVGKTRLASEAAKSAAGLGFTTAQAVASRAAAAIPFGPFAPFLPEAGYSPGDLLGLLRKASDAILDRAGPDRGLLLVVDDAQFLDEGSAAVRVEQGQLTRASRAFLDAASVNRDIHDPAALRWSLAGLAMAEAMSGYTDRATAAAAERDELPAGSMLIYEPDLIERGKAWLNVATGSCRALARSWLRRRTGRPPPSCASPKPGCCTIWPASGIRAR